MPIPQKSQPIKKLNSKDIVYSTIKEWIVSGTLKPGEKIVDTELAKYFSVSRTPVREALQLLSENLLIEIIPSRGTRVSEINWDEIKECYFLMAELQADVVRLAFPHLTDEDIQTLTKLNQEFAAATADEDINLQSKKDSLFHEYLIEKTNNRYIAQYIHQLQVPIQRIENLYFKTEQHMQNSAQYHQKIIDALQAHHLEDAEEYMRNNWLFSYDFAKKLHQTEE